MNFFSRENALPLGATLVAVSLGVGVLLGRALAGPWPDGWLALGLAAGLAALAVTAWAAWRSLTRARRAELARAQHDKALIAALQLEVERGRLTKEALVESDARYRSLFHDSHQAMLLIDPHGGRIRDANPAACRYYGHRWTELAAMSLGQLDASGQPAPPASEPGVALGRHRLADGRQRQVELHSSPIAAVGLVHVIVHDITEKQAMERALVESGRKLAAIVEAVGEAMVIFDQNLAMTWANDQALALLGQGGEARATAEELARACLQGGQAHEAECGQDGPDGRRHFWATARPVETAGDGAAHTALVMLREVTAKKNLEAEAAMAAHLASIGELAAGVAHEINNPINGVINLAQLIIDRADSPQARAEYPALIIQEGQRISTIVANLLSFARPHSEEPAAVDLAAVLGDALALMGNQLTKRGARLELDLPADLPPALGRRRQLQQVFMNLISNAQQALDQRFPTADPRKTLTIQAARHESADGRPALRLRFIDNGVGLAPAMQRRVFEPFFSTKPPGQGTGLGLSVSHGIVRDHGGRIIFESREGGGATVIVDLPAAVSGEGAP